MGQLLHSLQQASAQGGPEHPLPTVSTLLVRHEAVDTTSGADDTFEEDCKIPAKF